MRKLIISLIAIGIILGSAGNAFAQIKYINGYYRSNGTPVRGHYRDVSNDGNSYNNANYLGYNY